MLAVNSTKLSDSLVISDARRRARRRVATGLERGGAGLLRGATCTGPEARAGEAGSGICPPDRQGPTVGWRPDSDSERVRGWSSTWQRKQRLGPWIRGSLGWADGVRLALGR